MKMRQRPAFTLVELLVVIAIVVILAALLFPVYARVRAAAGDAMTISNCRQLGLSFHLYMDDFDDVYPQAADGTPGQNQSGGWIYYSNFGNTHAGTFEPDKGSLYPYVNSKYIYMSPADNDANISGDSFAMNGVLTTWNGTGLNPGRVASSVANPAGTMLVGEEGTGSPSFLLYGYVNGTNDAYFNPPSDHFGKFHPGGSAILFCDGHSKIMHAEENFISTVCGSPTICYH